MLTEINRLEYSTVLESNRLLTTLATDISVSLTLLSAPGPQGLPGMAGPSGLEAEVSTDFALIYHLST
jgi:hypothetical protein